MHPLNTFYAYALLRQHHDEYHITNPLDLLVPVMERVLRIQRPREIQPSDLQQWILQSWGFEVPQHVLRFLMRRLVPRGAAAFDETQKSWIYVSTPAVEAEAVDHEKEARATYERLAQKIRLECLRRTIDLDPDDILRRFLDRGAFALFDTTDQARFDPDDDAAVRVIVAVTGAHRRATSNRPSNGGSTGADKKDNETLNDLMTLSTGDMLYRAIASISEYEYFDPETNPLSRRMEGVRLVLDTGVLFRALGMMGEERHDATAELLDMAKYVGCELCAFWHTLEEMQESLRAVSTRLEKRIEPFGPMIDYALANGLGPPDLLDRAAVIQEEIAELHVAFVHPPPRIESLGLDELSLDYQIEIDVKQDNPTARRRDVDSLTAIYRMRDGKPQTHLEDCHAVFVTANGSLARAGVRYFQRYFRDEGMRNVVQLCVTESVLAGRLWVKVPTVFSNLPRSQIITSALSNLRAEPGLRQRFEEYLKDLVENGRVTGLQATRTRLSGFAGQLLALETDNDMEKIDEQLTLNVVEEALRDQRSTKLRLLTGARLEEREKYGERLKTERELSSAKLGKAQEEVNELNREIEDLRAGIWIAEAGSLIVIGWIVRILGVVLVAGVLTIFVDDIIGMLSDQKDSVSFWMRATLSCILGVVTVATVDCAGLVGWITRQLKPIVEDWIIGVLRNRRKGAMEQSERRTGKEGPGRD